tara:strand:- start:7 stop:342 length:336 start_codon:yes stop_codon:yes gene_type:complete
MIKVTGRVASKGVNGSINASVSLVLDEHKLDGIKKNTILVVSMTTPDFVPHLDKLVGIVTDVGGRTCHAAIVAREFNIPCIVGTGKATTIFKDGEFITLDVEKGEAYALAG